MIRTINKKKQKNKPLLKKKSQESMTSFDGRKCMICQKDEAKEKAKKDSWWMNSSPTMTEGMTESISEIIPFCQKCLLLIRSKNQGKPTSKQYVKDHRLESLTTKEISDTLDAALFAQWVQQQHDRKKTHLREMAVLIKAQNDAKREKKHLDALVSHIQQSFQLAKYETPTNKRMFRAQIANDVREAEHLQQQLEMSKGLIDLYLKLSGLSGLPTTKDVKARGNEMLLRDLKECQRKNLEHCHKIRSLIDSWEHSQAD